MDPAGCAVDPAYRGLWALSRRPALRDHPRQLPALSRWSAAAQRRRQVPLVLTDFSLTAGRKIDFRLGNRSASRQYLRFINGLRNLHQPCSWRLLREAERPLREGTGRGATEYHLPPSLAISHRINLYMVAFLYIDNTA